MNRRSLLKSLGALAAVPLMPAMPFSTPTASAAVASAVDARTYKWAEMIVRAHNKCSPAMLERLIGLSPAKAAALQAEFVSKGVIGAQSQFGIHQATKPLWDSAFPKPHIRTKKVVETVKEFVNERLDEDDLSDKPEIVEADDTFALIDLTDAEISTEEPNAQPQA